MHIREGGVIDMSTRCIDKLLLIKNKVSARVIKIVSLDVQQRLSQPTERKLGMF